MKIIKAIIDDFKKDLKFIKDLVKGEAKVQERTADIVKELKSEYQKGGFVANYFKDNWFWILFAVLTFCVGLWFGSIYYGNECNVVLVEKISECIAHYEGDFIMNPFQNLTIS